MDVLFDFVLAFFGTVAFAMLFQAPWRSLTITGIIGACGWTVFAFFSQQLQYNSFYAIFAGTVIVSLLSELAARYDKQPATIFVVPGIIPLVPGLGLYGGMTKIIEKNIESGLDMLFSAGTDACGIALGIMFMTSVFRVLKISRERKHLQKLLRMQKKENSRTD